MPLRDHFHPPISEESSWDMVHGMWPAMIVQQLSPRLPRQYVAGPLIHLGSQIEIDVGSFETEKDEFTSTDSDNGEAWLHVKPSVAVETDLLRVDNYEVQVFDRKHNRRLVAAIEIVSPSNKDRPETRRDFVAKCASRLRKGVSVAIVDLVTDRHFNLYAELLDLIGHTDPAFGREPPATYAIECRWIPRGRKRFLEAWAYTLDLGQPLPTIPLWLAENLAVPLDLESSYEETCRILRIV